MGVATRRASNVVNVGYGTMAEKRSRLSTKIDFDEDGKHCDYLQLPHSVHRSAYGWLPAPLVCVKNGEGPTVLLTSGVHGDEYEGQVTLTRLIRELRAEDVAGRIIIMPMANYPAAKAGLRTSPIDALNMNRVFPGDADGALTEMLVHYIELMPRADYLLDLHSGGSSLMYLPTAILRVADMPDEMQERVVELGQVFGAPIGFFFPSGQGGGNTNVATAARHGVVPLGTEMGGTGTITPECLRICEAGVRRVLRHIGVWRGPGPVGTDEQPAVEPRMLAAESWEFFTYASEDGLFEPLVELGDEVKAGQHSHAGDSMAGGDRGPIRRRRRGRVQTRAGPNRAWRLLVPFWRGHVAGFDRV